MSIKDCFADEYILQHKTDNFELKVVVKDVLTNSIIESFVSFLLGCGHYDECIYETMRELSDTYFEIKQKRKEFESGFQPTLD